MVDKTRKGFPVVASRHIVTMWGRIKRGERGEILYELPESESKRHTIEVEWENGRQLPVFEDEIEVENIFT